MNSTPALNEIELLKEARVALLLEIGEKKADLKLVETKIAKAMIEEGQEQMAKQGITPGTKVRGVYADHRGEECRTKTGIYVGHRKLPAELKVEPDIRTINKSGEANASHRISMPVALIRWEKV